MEKVEAVPGLDLEKLEALFARWIHASAEIESAIGLGDNPS